MSKITADFPFSAVQGQDLFKKALILNAINPAIGGVLVSGPKGSAKSTLARSLAHIIPSHNNQQSPFVSLPLGTSIEMLTGTLDIEEILNNQEVKFSEGLLSKVDGGILYVDEVNLLPDHLVDQLLDVAASGVNLVERDGISHSHQSRFSLIGTMNPDEGELRGQLTDRFGLMVNLASRISIEHRIAIVKNREAFDRDPQSFIKQYEEEQRSLISSISQARLLLDSIACSDAVRIHIAECCDKAAVEGVRADLVMYRAALANAALRGDSQIGLVDIEAVEDLVLAHRRRVPKTPPNNNDDDSQPSDNEADQTKSNDSGAKSHQQSPFKRPEPKQHQTRGSDDSHQQFNDQTQSQSTNSKNAFDDQAKDTDVVESDWGKLQANSEKKSDDTFSLSVDAVSDLKTLLSDNAFFPLRSSCQKMASHINKGSDSFLSNTVNDETLSSGTKKRPAIAWIPTILRSARQWPCLQLVYRDPQKGNKTQHIILLDTSASTLHKQLNQKAQACISVLSKHAYLKRESIKIIGFGNDQVSVLLDTHRAPKELTKMLKNISVAGGTPLRVALAKTKQTIETLLRKSSSQMRCYLITDGRSRADVSDLKLPVPTVLIDTEDSMIKRGRGPMLSKQLGAQYYLLPS